MTINRLRRQFQTLYGYRQPVRRKNVALIGHPDGRINDTENPGSVFVRIEGDNGRVRHALCRSAVPRYDLAVLVAYEDEWPERLEVIGEDPRGFPPDANASETPTSWPGPSTVGKHAPQHDIGGGDTDWIQSARLLPLGAFQNDTANMRVLVKPGWYPYGSGANYFPGAVTEDMTAYLPATAGVINWRIVYIEGSTNVLGYTQTGDVADDLVAIETILDALGTGRVPVCAVALVQGMTAIEQAAIFDLRMLILPMPGTFASGGGSGLLWDNVIVVAKSGGDFTTIQGALDSITDASVSNYYLAWVMPGTYAENVTLKGYVDITAFGGGVFLKPATGVPVTVPVTAEQSVLTGFQIAPQDGSAAIQYASTSAFTVQLDDMHIVGTIDASSAGTTARLIVNHTTRVTGTITTKAQFYARGADLAGALTLTSGITNCEIIGGNLDGAFTHVAAVTIYLFDLPYIGGAVSGAGTIVGAYLNSSGHIVFVNGTAMSGFANPTGLIGMAAVNGTATTATRSDATHAIDPAIAPTWTGLHTFDANVYVNSLLGVGTSPSSTSQITIIRTIGATGTEQNGVYLGTYTDTGDANARNGLFVDMDASHPSSSTVGTMRSIKSVFTGSLEGATTSLFAHLYTETQVDTLHTLSDLRHIYLTNPVVNGSLPVQYGIYIANLTTATNDYGIYIAGADTLAIWVDSGVVQFDGSLNIGTASGAATGEARASVGFAARVDGSGGGFWLGASSDVFLWRSASAVLAIGTGTTLHNQISSVAATATVFNETGADIDFCVEGDNEANLFFVDASIDAIGMGTGTPTSTARLDVRRTWSLAIAGGQRGVFLGTTYSVADSGIKNGIQSDVALSHTSGTLSDTRNMYATTNFSGNGGTTSLGVGFNFVPTVSTGHTVSDLRGFTIANAINSGTITAQYGIFIGNLTAGGSDYGIYIQGADTYALWSDAGLNRFDGDGTHVFELPADATAGVDITIDGRIPIKVGGATKYIRYYSD